MAHDVDRDYWPTLAVLIFGAPPSLKAAVAATLIVSLASPYWGLLAVAAFVPLAGFYAADRTMGISEEAGAQSLEACMASSITQAREGSLYLMCGGKPEVFERARPVLAVVVQHGRRLRAPANLRCVTHP